MKYFERQHSLCLRFMDGDTKSIDFLHDHLLVIGKLDHHRNILRIRE